MQFCGNLEQQSHKPIRVFVYPHQIVLMSKDPTSVMDSSNHFYISRYSNDMFQKVQQGKYLHEQISLIQVKQVYLFAGIIHIKHQQFIIFVDDAKIIGTLEGHFVYQINKIYWMSRIHNFKKDEETEEIQQAITDLIESGGYYFSYGYDLSKSKQSSQHLQFIWNSHLLWESRKFKISSFWQIPIIQGFVGILNFEFMYKPKVVYALISRRSNRRAGTRFYTRGIDDEGEVANYVQTEQLIFTGVDVISHIQIRGSVPLFWEQRGIDGIQSKLTLSRSLQISQKSFIGHLQKVKQTYKRCFVINLLNKNKQSEGYLTQQFEQIININKNIIQDFVKYEYFNFHEVCGSSHFDRCNPLITKIQPIIQSFGYFHTRNGKVMRVQEGIVRTNCLDCLDRTNFIQAKIAITLFEIVLRSLDFQFDLNLRENMDNIDCLKMVKQFKVLWADNGDMISMHYTGMPSTHTDVTRDGKRTFFGMIGHKLKSLGRFYKQFTDIKKQQTINLLLGYTQIEGSVTEKVEKQLRQKKNEYSSLSPLPVLVITWNVEFSSCPRRFFSKLSNMKQLPNLIVIGLQNVYQCNKLIQTSDTVVQHIKSSWKKLLEIELVKECGYTILSEKFAEGSGLLIYFKNNKDVHLWDFGGFSTTEINFSGVLDKRSQGILMTRLKVQNTTLLFANFNFEKGTDLFEHCGNIHEDAFQHVELGRQREQRIDNIDYRILFGHLGNTLLHKKQYIFNLIQKYKSIKKINSNQASKVLTELVSYDILHRSKDTHPYLQHYNEGSLNFLPTSTLIQDETYDLEQIPSYSSRILMYSTSQSIVKQLTYNPLYELGTHHIPVMSIYTFEIWKEDKNKKKQIYEKIIKK